MSKATKRKHVAREVLEEFVVPSENQQVAKVSSGRGNNLHEVECITGERFLASMPTKFRKNVWIKRGDFVVIESINEGDKVKAEIVHILYKHNIRFLKQNNLWPKAFDNATNGMETADGFRDDSQHKSDSESGSDSGGVEHEDDDMALFVNTNRPDIMVDVSTDSSTSQSDEEIYGTIKS